MVCWFSGVPKSAVEDVISGVVTPVNEQGANVARLAALKVRYISSCVNNCLRLGGKALWLDCDVLCFDKPLFEFLQSVCNISSFVGASLGVWVHTMVAELARYCICILRSQAGFPVHVPGVQLNRMCGSGQQAVHFGAQAIASGDMDIVVRSPVHSPLLRGFSVVHAAVFVD